MPFDQSGSVLDSSKAVDREPDLAGPTRSFYGERGFFQVLNHLFVALP